MIKEKRDLIDELASKMATNDLMYDARVRYITKFADSLEKLFAMPIVKKAEGDSVCSCTKRQWCKACYESKMRTVIDTNQQTEL